MQQDKESLAFPSNNIGRGMQGMSLYHDSGLDQFLGLGGQDEALERVLVPGNIGDSVDSYDPCENEGGGGEPVGKRGCQL